MENGLLNDSRRQLEAVCNNATVALFIMDERQQCIYLNPAAEQLTGFNLAELQGKPLHDLIHHTRPDGSPYPLSECPIDQALPQNNQEQGEEVFVHRDGHFYHVAYTASPIRQDGEAVGTVIEVRDITEEKKAEQERNRLAQQRQLALHAARLGWWHYDPVTQLATWDERYAEIFGVPGRQLPNEQILARLHPEDLPRVWAAVEAALDPVHPKPYATQFRITRPGGEVRWIEAHGRATFAGQGELRRATDFAGTVEDITERKQAQETLRTAHDTFRHLVENSPFGIYVVDADFRLVQVSAGAQKVFENVRPLLGRDFAEVLRCIWPEPFASEAIGHFRQVLETGEPYHAPRTIERRSDIDEIEAYDWKVERLVLPDGRLGVVCHFYDLSERLQYEQALRDADRRKDEFLAMLAHELRNPLGPILNAAEVLRTQSRPDRVDWAVGIVQAQTRHLARLLDDLLDVSRVTHGKISLRCEALELTEVVQRALELARSFVDERGHALHFTPPPAPVRIQGDADRLGQVVFNLITNAAKYTERGGKITLDLTVEGSEAVLRVRDTGKGIPPELLPRIFDLFTQGEQAPDRAEGGLGIGLSVVKQLVALHSGKVEAYSEGPGRGSEFVLRLPACQGAPPQAQRPSEHEVRAPGRSLRLFVVEDNVSAAETLVELLMSWGHHAVAYFSGAAALEPAPRDRPDVILLDIGLPGMDGHEVAARLRRMPELSNTTLIALTGYGQEEDRRRSAAAGIDVHLVKPIDPLQLREVLSRL